MAATFPIKKVCTKPGMVQFTILRLEARQRTLFAWQLPAVVYDVDEAAEALRPSRSVLYELIRSGRLRTVKQGRRRLVPVSALAEYVDSLGRRT